MQRHQKEIKLNKRSIGYENSEKIKIDDDVLNQYQKIQYNSAFHRKKYIGSKYQVINKLLSSEEDPVGILLNKP
jgi:hypothetical protein